MNTEDLWGKADQALASARLLLKAGDTSGTCNRAYYAMFDAARAALQRSGVGADSARSHSGLIQAFSLHLVKPGVLPKELGQSFARAHELRLIADYTGDAIDAEDASAALTRAEQFVEALIRHCRVSLGGA